MNITNDQEKHAILGILRKLFASSLQVFENIMEQPEALNSAFYILIEKLLEQKDSENTRKVSRLFAFFYTYFTVYLLYICSV